MIGDLAAKFDELHARFAHCFRRKESVATAREYLRGLLLADDRKSMERMAIRLTAEYNGTVNQNDVVAMQRFLTHAKWQGACVQDEIQRVFAEQFAEHDSPIGTVGIIDESSFEKSGNHSVGVKRQWCGRLGKKENCQVGVYLVGLSNGATVGIDQQLYLPQEWIDDKPRRKRAKVPNEIRFETKPEIATRLIRRTVARGSVSFDWATADELYGRNGAFLDALEADNQRYLVEVPANTTVWDIDDETGNAVKPRIAGTWSVSSVANALESRDWETVKLREGEKGPLVFKFYPMRVRSLRHNQLGPEVTLLIRRSLDRKPETKYYISNAAPDTPTKTLGMVSGSRWRVEEYFEDCKSQLGMADYETRSWQGWHNHMALVALAHLYATMTKRDLLESYPKATLQMALRLIRAAIADERDSIEKVLAVTQYHLDRNETARQSHRKAWIERHSRVARKVLL